MHNICVAFECYQFLFVFLVTKRTKSAHFYLKNMKIGIITLPFNTNYGGILQAYALQQVLVARGHEVLIVHRHSKTLPAWMKALSFVKRFAQKFLFGQSVVLRKWPTKREEQTIAQHTQQFIAQHLHTTFLLPSEKSFFELKHYHFDAYIVGSDQVWRPKYSPCLRNHFLGFLDGHSTVLRIAYAASFGSDAWEFSAMQTKECRELATKFDAVSVREDSAIKFCKEHLHVDAIHVLDPAMLLAREEYVRLLGGGLISKSKRDLTVYILDKSQFKTNVISFVSNSLELLPKSLMPEKSFDEVGSSQLHSCVFPPVSHWIQGFSDAEFIVTDSFHGVIFSIIFNKQFLVIANRKRGITRVTSLLKIFGLESRLIAENDNHFKDKLNHRIDYVRVNQIVEKKREESLSFLEGYLSSKKGE